MATKRSALASLAAIGATLLALFGSTRDASAAGDTIIHAFLGGQDGAMPRGALIADKDGNLYGTTQQGNGRVRKRMPGPGTIFKITPDGTKSIVSYLGKGVGRAPFNGLLRDNLGNLYGTTSSGPGLFGAGAVFELTHLGKMQALHLFECDPCNSWSNLIADQAGNLYGTTDDGYGAVFKLAPDGTFTTLHAFLGGNDGVGETSGLIMDGAGNLYGTTPGGGGSGCESQGCGTVFEIAPDGTETVIYRFGAGADGAVPDASLVSDTDGNLYGTTLYGGGFSCTGPVGGCGTVFKVAPDGTESVLYAFKGGSDGSKPDAGLIIDKAGTLYGVTEEGGDGGCGQYGGCGTVFKIAPDGAETILYAFSGGTDGAFPSGGLIEKSGYLYGVTDAGGGGSDCSSQVGGCGTVFSVKH